MFKMTFRVAIKQMGYGYKQNRFALEDDRKLNKKAKKYDHKEECEKALYRNEKGLICMPDTHILASMVKASTSYTMQGKKTYKDAIKGGVFIEPELIPLNVQDYVIDLQSVVIQRARIVKALPLFNDWEVSFILICIDERVLPETLKDILEYAGRYYGLGDYRPRYGKFEIVEFTRIDN